MNLNKNTRKNIEKMSIKKAKQSECRYKVSAIGLNKKSDIVCRITNKVRFHNKYGGLHAERLVMELSKKLNIRTIIISRVNKNGKIMKMEVCEKCAKIAKKLNIKIISLNE